jgi:RNA polymerase primary sigma factor
LQALAEQSRIVRLPLNKVGLTNKITRAFNQLEQEFEREPTPEELADMLEMETEEIAASLSISGRHVSMDAPVADGEDGSLIDLMVNPNADHANTNLDHHESLRTEITRSLNTLTDRQKEVLCFFFGIGVENPLSLEDIGQRFHLTRERVRQIKDKALAKLQNANRSKLLKVYLGN